MKKKSKEDLKKEALKEVRKLFREANYIFHQESELADKYVKMARKLAMKVNLKLPSEIKKRFCKHCYSFLVPGKNCRVRTAKKRIIYYCANCKKFMRFGIK